MIAENSAQPPVEVVNFKTFADLIEKYDITHQGYVNLSLTQRCNWKCIFCYKSCPRSVEFSVDDLRKVLHDLFSSGIRFCLTGGEPTIHPNWRDVLHLAFMREVKASIITNAGGIRLKSDEDINLIINSTDGCQVSIHGVGEGAVKVTGSKVQKGLAFLEKMAGKCGDDYHITVTTLVMRENAGEISTLLERVEKIYDEYGKPDEISISPPTLVGSMVENKKSLLSFEEFQYVVQSFVKSLPIHVSAKLGENPPLSLANCIEIEPDGYVYADWGRIRVGSWRKHSISELITFYYQHGLKIAKEKWSEKLPVNLPEFNSVVGEDFVYELRGRINAVYTKNGVLLLDQRRMKSYSINGVDGFLLSIALQYPFSTFKNYFSEYERIFEVLSFLESEGVLRRKKIRVMKGFEIVEN